MGVHPLSPVLPRSCSELNLERVKNHELFYKKCWSVISIPASFMYNTSASTQGELCGFASVLVPPTKCRKASELEINALNQMKSAGNT